MIVIKTGRLSAVATLAQPLPISRELPVISKHPNIGRTNAVWHPSIDYGTQPDSGDDDSSGTTGLLGTAGVNHLLYDFNQIPNLRGDLSNATEKTRPLSPCNGGSRNVEGEKPF